MKKLFTLTAIIFAMVVSSCNEFDDSAIWDKLNEQEQTLRDHENRIKALEELCKQMNTNISALQTIVEALEGNDYITNVSPITKDGEVIGYTITFSNSETITIYNGTDGEDGYTPQIGIKQASDGYYYWTINGEWLLDEDGNKIRTTGNDGDGGIDGKDGITPRLKIENDYWYVSYDEGATWTKLGKATGDDGESGSNIFDGIFVSISQDAEYVYIHLADGSVIILPKGSEDTNEDTNAKPTLPEDPEPANTKFNHRVLLIDHTGVNCGYCPRAIDNLRALAETEWHNYYNEVTCHAGSYASGDPANSAAANALNAVQSKYITGYPSIVVNFSKPCDDYLSSTIQSVLKTVVNKNGADVGISLAVTGDQTNVYCAAQVKSAKEQEYKVVAWLLESNIYSPNQSGATKDYHKIYNFALRNISGNYSKTNVQGESVGVIAAGETMDFAFELPITSSKWAYENMDVLVIVSAKDSNDRWEVANTALCHIGESKAYEYIQ